MSYSTHESLEEIMQVLRSKLPHLEKVLRGEDDRASTGTLHGIVEMLSSLIARYDRGEIIEKD